MTDYSRDPLFLLHDVARMMRTDADKRARAFGMTRAQWVLLMRVSLSPGLSQKELSELLEVEPITVARLVDRLVARGMVERRADKRDRRVWRLHLLPQAEPVLADIAVQKREMLRMVTDGLDPRTLETLTDALLHMKERLCAERRAEANVNVKEVA